MQLICMNPLPKYHPWHLWVHLTEQFCQRKLKCEKVNNDRLTPSNTNFYFYIVTFVYWNIVYIESCMCKSVLGIINKLHIVHSFLHLNCDSICNDLMIAFCDKQRLLFLLSTICVIIILKSLLDGFPHPKSNILLYHCFMSVQYFQPKAPSIIFSYKNTQYITWL